MEVGRAGGEEALIGRYKSCSIIYIQDFGNLTYTHLFMNSTGWE